MRCTYSYEAINGHVIALDGGSRLLIDTGAPSSVGGVSPLVFAGKAHQTMGDYMGVASSSLGGDVGSAVDAIIGMDILGLYDLTINPASGTITLDDDETALAGEPIPLEELLGIPIVTCSVRGQTFRMFFDTGAKLSYLDPEITAPFPKTGTEEDFHPGFGRFTCDVRDLPIVLGGRLLTLRVGSLPPLLRAILPMAGTSGILGTAILKHTGICLAMRRNLMALGILGT